MDMQNVKELEITEGNVRTIHDNTKRLLWGRLAYDTKYEGNTFQQTYTGKNLAFNGYQNPVTSADVTFTSNADGTISTSGTASSNVNFYISNYLTGEKHHIPEGTYTLSTDTASSDSTYFVFTDTTNPSVYWDSRSRLTQTVPAGGIDVAFRIVVRSGVNMDGVVFKIQLEEGSYPTAFEPYVGGIPSPNPDFPQDVDVVTGTQTVWLHGKNMFNKTSAIIGVLEGDGSIGTSDLYSTSDFIMVNPNTTYYKTVSGSARFKYYSFDKTPLSNVYNDIENASQAQSFTTPSNAYWIRLSFYNPVKDTLQIELGSTATTYEAYQGDDYTVNLGSTELCKIGDFKDYIYKSGTDWYIHKVTNKKILTGTESWVTSGTLAYTTSITDYATTGNTPISTAFTGVTNVAGSTSVRDDTICFINQSGQTTPRFYIKYPSKFNTGVEIVTWLQTNNTPLYYALDTPTDTQITDTTLITQLDAIHEWLTRYGYQATVSGNLPLIINQTNLS